jgi:hypothetical protein
MDFTGKTTAELLTIHAAIMEELRNRKILRSANNPTGDLAEYLFCSAFGWKQEGNSTKSYDAIDIAGIKYQIKGRRIHQRNKSRQLSAIRDLDGFDVLAVVLFDDDYKVTRAGLIPSARIREGASYIAHTNSYRFMAKDTVWNLSGVVDVTAELLAVP